MQKLGQHFLKNKSAIKKIIDSLKLTSGDTVIEIGAGHGELTEQVLAFSFELLDKSTKKRVRLIAIEKDFELTRQLKEKFAAYKNLEVIYGDALNIVPTIPKTYNLKAKSYKLMGNIPYYITGRLLRTLSELSKKPELCVLTIQKEVAERMVAKPPKMNRLAAITQFWAEPEIVSIIPRKDFDPQPEVDSAIVKLGVKSQESGVRSSDYYKTVKMLFAQPRKTILNNMCQESGVKGQESNRETINKPKNREAAADLLQKLGINPSDRPQNLSVEEIIKISHLI